MKNSLKYHVQPTTANHMCSFILRLWREEQHGIHDWRASIEIPESGKRIGFASLEQLFAFLVDFTESNCDIHIMDGQDRQYWLK